MECWLFGVILRLGGGVLSPFVFAVVSDVVTELARNGVLSELLFAND